MFHHCDPISARLAAALQLVHEAGELTLEYFQQDQLAVDRKADDSPVTQADRNAEQLLRRGIERLFPHDAVIGEEFGEQSGTSGYTWILDPIDGTKSFIGGVPLYSQLIGILAGDESVAGVIAVPALQECVFGAIGHGAWWRRRLKPPVPARVSKRGRLAEGIFLTSQVDSFDQRGSAEAYSRLERMAYVSRTWGDGYGYLLVATGRAEVMVDPIMNVWDAAAIRPVVVEAGGTFTDWQGRPTIRHGEGIATNGLVLEEVLKVTRDFPKRA
jgi:histidinol-phosphatase